MTAKATDRQTTIDLYYGCILLWEWMWHKHDGGKAKTGSLEVH